MGPIVGAAVLHILRDQIMPLTEMWRLILGLSIIAMVLLFPQGLVAAADGLLRRSRRPPMTSLEASA
jgi:branched-chain amino acid transport system permease protein